MPREPAEMGSAAHFRGSFRDPSGFVFQRDGVIYRQVQDSYAERYRHLMDSGLYGTLVERGLLIPHEEHDRAGAGEGCFRVLKPRQLGFTSYPYEWSLSQLRDAALATLEVQQTALSFGMGLKDASAYNIQFVDGQPMLVDTLSFDFYTPGRPWTAYRQFCQHFLGPLALMKYHDPRSGMLLRLHTDGIPLDMVAGALPLKARLAPSLFLHIVMHARFQGRYAAASGADLRGIAGRSFPPEALKALITGLRGAVEGMVFPSRKGVWTDYYDTNNYTEAAFRAKERIVRDWLTETSPSSVWDLGANDGHFSFLASGMRIGTIAMDSDPTVVERCYARAKEAGDRSIHPLLIDLTNPSPSLGWAHEERLSLIERGPADMVMALALIHHIAIGNNVPLADIAAFLSRCGRTLITEFVPKSDSQVRRMLSTREDIFPQYTRDGFEESFRRFYTVRRRMEIPESERSIYLMERL